MFRYKPWPLTFDLGTLAARLDCAGLLETTVVRSVITCLNQHPKSSRMRGRKDRHKGIGLDTMHTIHTIFLSRLSDLRQDYLSPVSFGQFPRSHYGTMLVTTKSSVYLPTFYATTNNNKESGLIEGGIPVPAASRAGH